MFFHATGIAVAGKGVLILGPSGSGKSTLALELIALGGALISDDGIWLEAGQLCAPRSAPALIEARGIGLLNAGSLCPSAPLMAVVDLSRTEPERLPPTRSVLVHDQTAMLILGAEQHRLAVSLLHLLRYGKADV
ncbi:serine kinase [Rhodobacteraceae bacterium M385]|nr:serine kinase [Rhodobacteraceae bacterium M385]